MSPLVLAVQVGPADRRGARLGASPQPTQAAECGGAVRLTLGIRRLSVLDAAEQLHGIEPVLAQVGGVGRRGMLGGEMWRGKMAGGEEMWCLSVYEGFGL